MQENENDIRYTYMKIMNMNTVWKGWQQQSFLTVVFHDANSTLDCENRLHSINGQQTSKNLLIHLTQQTVFGNPCHMAHIPATIRMACYMVTKQQQNFSSKAFIYIHTHTHTYIYIYTHMQNQCAQETRWTSGSHRQTKIYAQDF